MEMNKPNALTLFSVFFRIGIGTIGGGYAMIPMMEHEVVERYAWLSKEDFLDMIAVAQTSPGVFAVNLSSHIGYKIGGISRAILCSVANVLPSFLIILLIAIGFGQIKDNPWAIAAFKAIRPVVVALIAAPVLTMAQSAQLGWRNIWIPIVAVILIYFGYSSPIFIILMAGIGGWLWHMIRK